mmetsp:Transcript_14789/g.25162  ORF Transcript_14789/g.25162 Transcript_14789/m.25162 type:complete len:173 (+) Transcript_14789:1090-1608(+)
MEEPIKFDLFRGGLRQISNQINLTKYQQQCIMRECDLGSEVQTMRISQFVEAATLSQTKQYRLLEYLESNDYAAMQERCHALEKELEGQEEPEEESKTIDLSFLKDHEIQNKKVPKDMMRMATLKEWIVPMARHLQLNMNQFNQLVFFIKNQHGFNPKDDPANFKDFTILDE